MPIPSPRNPGLHVNQSDEQGPVTLKNLQDVADALRLPVLVVRYSTVGEEERRFVLISKSEAALRKVCAILVAATGTCKDLGSGFIKRSGNVFTTTVTLRDEIPAALVTKPDLSYDELQFVRYELEQELRTIAAFKLKEDPRLPGERWAKLDGHSAAGFIRIARRGLGLPAPDPK